MVATKIIVLCVIVALLSPIVSYLYFSQGNTLQNDILKNENQALHQEIADLEERLEKAENLTKANLAADLGWYLHDGSDPVPKSRYKFTIYGYVANIGLEPAYDCKIIIKFYRNQTLLQTSQISMGKIKPTNPLSFDDVFQIYKRDIDCKVADSVTRIEVTREWT